MASMEELRVEVEELKSQVCCHLAQHSIPPPKHITFNAFPSEKHIGVLSQLMRETRRANNAVQELRLAKEQNLAVVNLRSAWLWP